MTPRASVLRGCLLAVLSGLLAATGHVAGGGSVPELAPLVVLLPLVAGVITEFAGRCAGVPSTVAVLAAGQIVLHELLVVLTPGHDLATVPSFDPHLMPVGHAIATLVLAVLVRHADAAVTAIATMLGRVVPRVLLPLASDRTPRLRVAPTPAAGVGAGRILVRAVPHRGPPGGRRSPTPRPSAS